MAPYRQQILEPSKIPKLARRVQGWDAVAIDLETNSLEPYHPDTRVLGIGLAPVALAEDEHYYLPVRHHEVQLNELDLRPLLTVLERKPLLAHDIKFDLHNLAELGCDFKQQQFFDNIVVARLFAEEEHPNLALDNLAEHLLGYTYHSPLKKKRKQLEKFSIRDVGHYCIEDVWVLKRVYAYLIANTPTALLDKLYPLECKLTRDLFDMERRGMAIDEEYLAQAIKALESRSSELLAEIRALAHAPKFNPRSPQQVRQVMAGIGIEPVKWTDKSEPSWDKEACIEVRHQHPVAMNLAKYRALKYQRDGHVARCERALAIGQPLHPELKNWGTVTGRLSGNTQQMPDGWLQFEGEGGGENVLLWAKGEMAKEREFSIRRLHCPRPGYILLKPDYRQIEMWVLGFYLNDPTFTRWLESGNVHAAVALEVWGVGPDHPEYIRFYDRGKVYNFAMVYGQGNAALAELEGISIEEAKEYRNDHAVHMPGHRKFVQRLRRKLVKDGHVSNIFGREYWLPPDMAYKAVNYEVQGSSGDYVKFRLPATRKLRQEMGVHTLNTTHDDFVFEVPLDSVGGIPDLLAALRKSPFKRDMELDVDYGLQSLVDLEKYEEGMTIAAA